MEPNESTALAEQRPHGDALANEHVAVGIDRGQDRTLLSDTPGIRLAERTVRFRRFPVKLVSELTVAVGGKIIHYDES